MGTSIVTNNIKNQKSIACNQMNETILYQRGTKNINNFYSVLSYNSEIWHMHTLNVYLKQQLLLAGAGAGLKTLYGWRYQYGIIH